MKKSKLLSLVISCALVFTTVFAGADLAFAAGTTNDAASAKTVQMKVSGSKLASGSKEAAISAPTLAYSTTALPTYKSYKVAVGDYKIIPVKATGSGLMYMNSTASTANAGTTMDVYLCDRYTITADGVDFTYYDWHYIDAGETDKTYSGMPVTAGKTYYIIIANDSYNDVAGTVSVRARIYSTLINRSLPQGSSKWTLASGVNKAGKTSTTWFKVTPNGSGVMNVALKEYGYDFSAGYVTLYDSTKKKVLSDELYYNSKYSDDRVYFGVKKGVTYYLKVTSASGSSDSYYAYGIKYTVKARVNRALDTKAKAMKLTRKGSGVNTLFTAVRANSTDWYKFYVSSTRKTVISIGSSDIKSGKLFVTVYKGSKKVGSTQTIYPYENSNKFEVTYGSTYGKASPGWYYVKVQKGITASSKYLIQYTQ